MPTSDRIILVVDDDPFSQQAAAATLRMEGYPRVRCCGDVAGAFAILAEQPVAVVLLDLRMPGANGDDVLRRIVSDHPETAVVVLTGANDVATAVGCMKAGAIDFLTKPIEVPLLVAALGRAMDHVELAAENRQLRDKILAPRVSCPAAFSRIPSEDASMQAVFHYVEAVAPTQQPVLITGETGTGKELLASTLHQLSGRRGPFVAVNIAGLDDTMLSDALFGHRKGAFTGADDARRGLVEQAAGGTLFLDEIGDLSQASQTKLLRLLQEREYTPIGQDAPRRTDARFLFATSRSLVELQDPGRFRKDLFYRLRAHHVNLPPLRERGADRVVLARRFAAEIAEELERPVPTLLPEALAVIAGHPFPGNVRELRSAMYDAIVRAGGAALDGAAMARALGCAEAAPAPAPVLDAVAGADFPTLREAQERLVELAVARCAGNLAQAARLLGVSRQGLYKMLARREAT